MKQENKFILHLDTPEHVLELSDFISLSQQIEIIYKNITQVCFKDTDYNIYLNAAERGSFKGIFTLCLIWIGTLTANEFAPGFIEGLTGKSLNELGKNAGQYVSEIFSSFMLNERVNVPETINLDAALKAKSNFYKCCWLNNHINGVGFSNESTFPIKRKDFLKYVEGDIIRNLNPIYKIQKLVIYKPINTEMEGNWSFKDLENNKILIASLQDQKFREEFLLGKHPLRRSNQNDTILALVRYNRQQKNGQEKIISKEIIDIYEFNNETLKDIPIQYLDSYQKSNFPLLYNLIKK